MSSALRAAALAGGLVLFANPSLVQAGRIPCSRVIQEFDRVVTQPGREKPDPLKIGKKLGVEPLWVERCAEVYGRRLNRKAPGFGLSKEEQDEVWEAEEREEVAAEERETREDVYFHELENDREKRRRLRRAGPEWKPVELPEWEPDTGDEWNPILLDK